MAFEQKVVLPWGKAEKLVACEVQEETGVAVTPIPYLLICEDYATLSATVGFSIFFSSGRDRL